MTEERATKEQGAFPMRHVVPPAIAARMRELTEPTRAGEFYPWADYLDDLAADAPDTDHAAACGHAVTDRQDLHWSDRLEDEVCPDCCEDCNP